MTYNESLKYAAQCFLAMVKKYPKQEPLFIAKIICKEYDVERLDMDEKVWELTNK